VPCIFDDFEGENNDFAWVELRSDFLVLVDFFKVELLEEKVVSF
jgi:hypothetical protein